MKQIKAHAKSVHDGRYKHLGMHSTSAHPGKNCASGGAAHSDVAEDRSMIKSMVKPSALNRAHGGGVHKGKGKGHTKINIVVGQPGQGAQQPVPVPVPVPSGGPMGGPMGGGMPPRPMPGPGGPGMAGVGALGGTAGLPRKRGGACRKEGGSTGSSGTGPGTLSGSMPLPTAGNSSGSNKKKGGMVHLTGGAGGGRGRLQKNHMR